MYLTQKPARVVINATCAKHRERKNVAMHIHSSKEAVVIHNNSKATKTDTVAHQTGLLLVRVGHYVKTDLFFLSQVTAPASEIFKTFIEQAL